jgi:hypothetical protein
VADHEGLVSGVSVNIDNFSHTSPDDVDLMLVAPSGRKVVLMSDVGGTNPVNNLSLSFDDLANDFCLITRRLLPAVTNRRILKRAMRFLLPRRWRADRQSFVGF